MKLVRDVTVFKLSRGDGQGPAGTVQTLSFENADLVGNILTVTHNKGISYVPPFSVTNQAGVTVAITGALSGVNAFTIDFSAPIAAGTWILAYVV